MAESKSQLGDHLGILLEMVKLFIGCRANLDAQSLELPWQDLNGTANYLAVSPSIDDFGAVAQDNVIVVAHD